MYQSQERMVLIGGVQEYAMRANWKLLAENAVDVFHLQPLHPTYFDMIGALSGSQPSFRGLKGEAHYLGNAIPLWKWIPLPAGLSPNGCRAGAKRAKPASNASTRIWSAASARNAPSASLTGRSEEHTSELQSLMRNTYA